MGGVCWYLNEVSAQSSPPPSCWLAAGTLQLHHSTSPSIFLPSCSHRKSETVIFSNYSQQTPKNTNFWSALMLSYSNYFYFHFSIFTVYLPQSADSFGWMQLDELIVKFMHVLLSNNNVTEEKLSKKRSWSPFVSTWRKVPKMLNVPFPTGNSLAEISIHLDVTSFVRWLIKSAFILKCECFKCSRC